MGWRHERAGHHLPGLGRGRALAGRTHRLDVLDSPGGYGPRQTLAAAAGLHPPRPLAGREYRTLPPELDAAQPLSRLHHWRPAPALSPALVCAAARTVADMAHGRVSASDPA